MSLPVIITVYVDKSFSFITKTPPAAILLKKAAKLEKGSGEPNRNKVGKELKMPDLNANNVEMAERIIAGTARSMGIEVKE